MRIVLLTTKITFIIGGAEMLTESLKEALIKAGHQVDVISIPFYDDPSDKIEDSIVAARLLEAEKSWSGPVDLCIGLKFPGYLIPHSNKVMWLMHQHRAAYDLFDTPFGNIINDSNGRRIRNVVRNADIMAMNEAKRIYTISDNVTGRLKKYCDIDAVTLYPPCPGIEDFYCEGSENYFVLPSRINQIKRQEMVLNAFAKTTGSSKLYIVGGADTRDFLNLIKENVKRLGLTDRVIFSGFISQEEKLRLYANARAVIFVPKDEDYGYITLEAMASSKPVITVSDSGGPIEFVKDGVTGLITNPDSLALADAINRLENDREGAIAMGLSGKARLDELNINWEHVVKELTDV